MGKDFAIVFTRERADDKALASSLSLEEEGRRQGNPFPTREGWQISLLFYLEEEEEDGKALFPSLEKDGNGEGRRHRLHKRKSRWQGSRLLSF